MHFIYYHNVFFFSFHMNFFKIKCRFAKDYFMHYCIIFLPQSEWVVARKVYFSLRQISNTIAGSKDNSSRHGK